MLPQSRSSSDLAHEREVLEELLKSEGWHHFVNRVEAEWQGPGYFARMGTALTLDDPIAPKVVHKASLEIMRALEWPRARITALKGHVE